MYKFYLEPRNQNEATNFYINIIKTAIESTGEKVIFTSSVKEIEKNDKVLVVSLKMFLFVWLNNPKQHIVTWYQGVAPEEAMCDSEHNILFKLTRKNLLNILERLALKYSVKNIFVSNAMLEHYRNKYKYQSENHIIIPCFNQSLKRKYFTKEKYLTPSFVYAGSLSEWQCIDETLAIYKKINRLYPNSSLTLLTKETEKAKLICERSGIKADIKYVPISDLEVELGKYKYGFIVRDNIIVNNVATPTKMNSYMSVGVIPIYSNVVYDFKTVFEKMKYVVPFMSDDECINGINRLENSGINVDDIINEYCCVFSSYYSVEKYVEILKESL